MNLEYLDVKQFYGDTINSTDDVKNYLAANKTVWVFCLNSYETNFINNWSKKGFIVKKYGSYNLEDTLLITEDGHELFSDTNRNLIIV